MNIIKDHTKSVTAALGAAAAAVAVPTILFAGAGTAHAGGSVWNQADYLGTTVFVQSDGSTYGNCTYTAVPMKGFGIPPAAVNFYLPQGKSAPLWFPGVKLNTTWNVSVTCDHGGPISATTVY